jgi:hypothetical protein
MKSFASPWPWLAAMALATGTSFAGEMGGEPPKPYPPLRELVRDADLILRCRPQMKHGDLLFRVTEVWKGAYRPAMFVNEHAGYVSQHGNNTLSLAWDTKVPAHQEEIHFLKFDRGTEYVTLEAFPLIGDKIVYPKTVLWGKKLGTVDRSYTVREFKEAITQALAPQDKTP